MLTGRAEVVYHSDTHLRVQNEQDNILLRSGDKKQPKLSMVTEDTKLNTEAECPCVSFVSQGMRMAWETENDF